MSIFIFSLNVTENTSMTNKHFVNLRIILECDKDVPCPINTPFLM